MSKSKAENRYTNWEQYAMPRIEELQNKGLFLEAFYLYSAQVEDSLKRVIEYYEEWIAGLLTRSNISFPKHTEKQLDEKTLGQLISIFSGYCNDEKLVSKLNDFNSFRKRSVHRLLDYSIEDLNTEAKEKRRLFYMVWYEVNIKMIDVLQKLLRREKRRH